MEPNIPNSSYAQKANEISALMAQVLKNPPDLTEFLRIQGAAIKRVLGPVGLSFFYLQWDRAKLPSFGKCGLSGPG